MESSVGLLQSCIVAIFLYNKNGIFDFLLHFFVFHFKNNRFFKRVVLQPLPELFELMEIEVYAASQTSHLKSGALLLPCHRNTHRLNSLYSMFQMLLYVWPYSGYF